MDKTQWKQTGLQEFKIGMGNVRTLYKIGTLGILVKAIDTYKVNIVASHKKRWQGKGYIPTSNMPLLYGGITTNKHKNSMGFLVHISLIL